MTLQTFLIPCAIALCLAMPAAHANGPNCTDVDGWNAGRHGKPADAACSGEAYTEAFRLGEALAELTTRRAALDERIAQSPSQTSALQRQQRQIDVDIEAIHGVATLRDWPTNLPEGKKAP